MTSTNDPGIDGKTGEPPAHAAPITRAELEELRWLARELLADKVEDLEAGGGPNGTLADMRRFTTYSWILGRLGTDYSITGGRTTPRWWDANALATFAEGAAWWANWMREALTDPGEDASSPRGVEIAALAARASAAAELIGRLAAPDEAVSS